MDQVDRVRVVARKLPVRAVTVNRSRVNKPVEHVGNAGALQPADVGPDPFAHTFLRGEVAHDIQCKGWLLGFGTPRCRAFPADAWYQARVIPHLLGPRLARPEEVFRAVSAMHVGECLGQVVAQLVDFFEERAEPVAGRGSRPPVERTPPVHLERVAEAPAFAVIEFEVHLAQQGMHDDPVAEGRQTVRRLAPLAILMAIHQLGIPGQ